MKESDLVFMLRFEENDGLSHRLESRIDSNNVIIGHTNHYNHYNNIKIPKVAFKYFMQHMNNIGSLLEEERIEMCMRGAKVPYPALMEEKFINSQKPLGEPFQKILSDNLEDMRES